MWFNLYLLYTWLFVIFCTTAQALKRLETTFPASDGFSIVIATNSFLLHTPYAAASQLHNRDNVPATERMHAGGHAYQAHTWLHKIALALVLCDYCWAYPHDLQKYCRSP